MKQGAELTFTVSEDVRVGDVLAIPRGAAMHGSIVSSKSAGTLTGSAQLMFTLDSLDLGGKTYTLYTHKLQVKGTSKTRPTETKVKTGAVVGAIVGGVFSGSAKGDTSAVGKLAGAGTGAALGASVGAAVSAVTPSPIVSIPAESQMEFVLAYPIAVQPVSAKEAAHLAEGLNPGGPVLYVRGETP